MTLVRLVARPMLSAMFLVGGINSFKNPDAMAQRAKPVTDKLEPLVNRATASLPITFDDKMMVRANGAIHIVGGFMLATGRSPRLTSFVLFASLIPTTLGGHRFWEENDPNARSIQKAQFFKNVSIAGGLLLASVDTEGRPGLTWRAKHGVGRAKKRAAELAHSS